MTPESVSYVTIVCIIVPRVSDASKLYSTTITSLDQRRCETRITKNPLRFVRRVFRTKPREYSLEEISSDRNERSDRLDTSTDYPKGIYSLCDLYYLTA